MAAKRLAHHHMPIPAVDEMWDLIEAAWTAILMHAIQSLYDSVPRRITFAISAGVRCSKVLLSQDI